LAWARTPRSVDTYCSGRLAGYLTAIFSRSAVCEEVFCQARGDPHCQFVITADGA
jgi:predicted hydrocarbon binding protein